VIVVNNFISFHTIHDVVHVFVTLFSVFSTEGMYTNTCIQRPPVAQRRRPRRGCAHMPVGPQPKSSRSRCGCWHPNCRIIPCTVGARRGEPTAAIRAMNTCQKTHVRRDFKNIICMLPLGPPDMLFRYGLLSDSLMKGAEVHM
jgi:hypothetical protein